MLLLTKHFNLTKLFSVNISFYISYPQLYSTAINHLNRLSVRSPLVPTGKQDLASELISKCQR